MKNSCDIPLKHIYLATKNPRISSIDFNDVTGNFFREKQDNKDKDNLLRILPYEGNLDNLLELFKSINNNFNFMLEKPILIEANNVKNEEKKIVIEGNRRIMVYKCLNELLEFPKSIGEWKSKINDEMVLDNKNEDLKVDTKKMKKNFSSIIEIIKNYSSNKEISIKADIIDTDDKENDEISIAIFSNHVTGNKRGKRNWNRGKTLTMYINFWKTIDIEGKDKNIEEEKIKKIANLLNRSEKDVKSNLYSASLINYLVENSGENQKEFYGLHKISSLEEQFIKKFINYNNEKRWNEEIKYIKDLNHAKIIFQSTKNNFSSYDLAKFIIESLKNNYFNTRGVVEKYEDKVINELSLFFKDSKKVLDEDFKKPFLEIGDLNLKESIINIEKFSNDNKSILTFYKRNIEIAKNGKLGFKIEYENELDNLRPFKKTLNNLLLQYKLLNNNKEIIKISDYPVNAVVSTLRSIIENICYLLMFNNDLIKEFKKSDEFTHIKLNNKKIGSELENYDFKSIFLNENIDNLHKAYSFLRNNYSKNEEKIKTSIIELSKNESIKNIVNLKDIFEDKIFRKISKIIHSPHFLFLENNEREWDILEDNLLFLESIIDLLKKLKWIE